MRQHFDKYSKKDNEILNSISSKFQLGNEIDYISIADQHQVDVMRVFAIVKKNKMEHIIPNYNMLVEAYD
jgi:hypothetical protein